MSTIEYRQCDYLGCIASVSADVDEWNQWGAVLLLSPGSEDELQDPLDLCPEHLGALGNLLEGGVSENV